MSSNFVNREQVRAAVSRAKSLRTLQEGITKAAAQSTVFLSYSHADMDLMGLVRDLLLSQGAFVYIDVADSSLQYLSNADAAAKLRNSIDASKKFVIVASSGAAASKWVQWELGYADGKKSSSNVAVFPILTDGQSWSNAEYIELYPTIQSTDQTSWYVVNPGGSFYSGTNLKGWLTR